MKSLMRAVLCVGILMTSAVYADIPASDPPAMIEVGTGVAISPNQPIEAIFQVTAISGTIPITDYNYLILAKISGTMTLGLDLPSYVDMQFELLGYGQSVNDLTIDFNLLTADIQRNVQIGNELAYRVSLIGVRGGYTREIMDDVTVYLKGAADLIGVGITQRRDGSKISGDGEGFGGELGAVLFDRVRIAVGGKTSSSNSDPQYKELGYYTCNDSFGRNGEYYSNSFHYSCYPAYSTHFQRSGVASSAYLSLVYDLMENLKVFGKASYNVYAFTDETGASANSRNEALLFILGVGGNF